MERERGKKLVGIVADDITGANDIGINFVKGGYRAGVFSFSRLRKQGLDGTMVGDLDAVVIDTDSRLDTPAVAAEKVKLATDLLLSLPCDVYYNKTCSVFRGNIGAEFDAMQDRLGVSCSMVIAGFPDNGRTTVDGLHFVDGIPLNKTQFAQDPIHPMQTASLMEIIGKQSDRRVELVTTAVLDLGVDRVRGCINELQHQCSYMLFDVRDNTDLALIAEAIAEQRNICGSSALGAFLPAAYNGNDPLGADKTVRECSPYASCGVLLVAGSLTEQTRRQVAHVIGAGWTALEFVTEEIFTPDIMEESISRISAAASQEIAAGQNVLLYTANSAERVESTKLLGRVYGMTDSMTGRKISSALKSCVRRIRQETGFDAIVVAGGDTSAAVAEGLGIWKMVIADEVAPGVPDMYGYADDACYRMVLKSGSFGADDFLERAAESVLKL